MQELLMRYARYNVWANKRIITALLQLEDGGVDLPIPSSFPSMRATLYHSWSAESIWLDRLNNVAQPVWHQGTYKGSFEDACGHWEQVSAGLCALVEKLGDSGLREAITYTDRQGNSFTTPAYEVLLHVFNHATYHRGQLVTMLRQAGVTDIPGTDVIGFIRT